MKDKSNLIEMLLALEKEPHSGVLLCQPVKGNCGPEPSEATALIRFMNTAGGYQWSVSAIYVMVGFVTTSVTVYGDLDTVFEWADRHYDTGAKMGIMTWVFFGYDEPTFPVNLLPHKGPLELKIEEMKKGESLDEFLNIRPTPTFK
jgi:hypothetical protein